MSVIYVTICVGVLGAVMAFIGVITISDARAGAKNSYNRHRYHSGVITTIVGGLLIGIGIMLSVVA